VQKIGAAVGLYQHRSFGIEQLLAAQYGLIGHDLSPNRWRRSCGMPQSGIPVALAWWRPWLARGEPQVHRWHYE
jgi:hypothetical protein